MSTVMETLPPIATKFEELSTGIEQLEPALTATKEWLAQWHEQTPEQLTQLLSQCDEWQEKLSGHQEELVTATGAMGEQFEQLGEQLTTTKSELEQEAASLKEAFASLRADYEGIDAEMATLFDEAEKAFQEAAQELADSQKSLSEAVTEAEAFLQNDVRAAYEQSSSETTARSEALRTDLVQAFVPEIKNHSQKLMEHLQQVTEKVEARFRAVAEQVDKSAKDSSQAVKDANKEAIGNTKAAVDKLACTKGEFLDEWTEADQQLKNLKEILTAVTDGLSLGIAPLGRYFGWW